MGSRMAKHRIRKTWKSITAQSRLSVPQVSATALAAITMAVVSSRLTSFSSSILIVGLISVVSALASEFYRILITSSAEKTKQVVAPILPVLAGEERSQGAEATADGTETAVHTDLTTTQPTLDDTVVAPVADVVSGHVTEPSHEGTPEQQSKHPILSAVFHNQVVQMSLIFLVVALITVGISYGVARAQGGDQFNSYTTNTVEQTLTDEQRQALVDETVQRVQQQLAEQDQSAGQTDGDSGSQSGAAPSDLTQILQENARLQEEVASLSALLETEQQKTDDLAARLEALEQQLGQQQETPSTTPGTGG